MCILNECMTLLLSELAAVVMASCVRLASSLPLSGGVVNAHAQTISIKTMKLFILAHRSHYIYFLHYSNEKNEQQVLIYVLY